MVRPQRPVVRPLLHVGEDCARRDSRQGASLPEALPIFCRWWRQLYSVFGVDWAIVGIFLGSDEYLLLAYVHWRIGRFAGSIAVFAGMLDFVMWMESGDGAFFWAWVSLRAEVRGVR